MIEPDAGWAQWGITSVLGLASALYGGALWILHGRVDGLRTEIDSQRERNRLESAAGDDKLWAELRALGERLEKHQGEMHAAHVANIARLGEIPTRSELRSEIDRAVAAVAAQARRD